MLLELNHKMNIIIGDSATGKSELADILTNRPDGVEIFISNGYIIVELKVSDWELILQNSNPRNKFLYLIDDRDFILSKEFAKLCNSVKGCIFIIINRTTLFNKSLKWNNIVTCDSAIYTLIPDIKYHYLSDYKDFIIPGIRRNTNA